jgi:RNase P subunit RPR2
VSAAIALGVRGDIRVDGDRCSRCHRLLADAQLHRVVHDHGDVDVLVLCRGCGQPTLIPWSRDGR